MLRFMLAALTAFFLFGCAAPQPSLSTPSGRPEVTIKGVSKKQVMDMIAERAMVNGLQLRSVNEYGAVLSKRVDSGGAAMFFGSRYDSTPEGRIHLSTLDVAEGVRVFGRAEMVTNPGSGFERVTDITQGQAHQMQKMLRDLAARFGQ